MPHYNKKDVQKPEWFDLDNYKNMINADLNQWADNFLFRLDLYMHLDETDQFCSEPDEENYIEEALTKCKEKGFFSTPEYFEISDINGASRNLPLIKDLTVGDIKMGLLKNGQESITKILKSLEPLDFRNGNIDQMHTNYKTNEEKEIDEIIISSTPDYFNFLCLASVDVTASVPDIMKEFKTWVVKKKNEHDNIARKNITVEDLRIWRDSMIIPYLDLFFWYKQQHEKIPTDFVMGNWIFPEQHLNGESQLREKTKPMLKKITSRYFGDYLWRQITKAS